MLTFAAVSFVPMLILAVVIIAKGGEDGISLSVFNPGETSWFGVTGGGVLGGRAPRHPPLRRLRGRGLDRRGVARPAPLDPARSPVHDRGVGRLLRRDGLRVLHGVRQGGRERGCLGGSPAAVNEMATKYIGSWFAAILDAGRDPGRDGPRARDLRDHRPRLLRALPRRPSPKGVREDLALRHAVGRQPGGRGRRASASCSSRGSRTTRAASSCPARTATSCRSSPGRVRDVHPLRDDRLVRRGGRVPGPGGGRASASSAGGQQAVAVRRSSRSRWRPRCSATSAPSSRRRTTDPT